MCSSTMITKKPDGINADNDYDGACNVNDR